MKFEESSLTGYLVKNLEPLTEADPVILAEYVAALLKKDKPIKELEKLCAEKLLEFLGQGTESFITRLFQALENSSFIAPFRSEEAIEQAQPSPSSVIEDQTKVELKTSVLKLDERSPSGSPSEEEKEVSDDDDDDRNHKHRRRETRSQSSDKDVQGQHYRRANRKRNRPFENGQVFSGSDPRPSENQKEYNPAALDRDFSTKFDKRRPGLAPSLRPGYDMSMRTRANQPFRGELGRLPSGRGRGRVSLPWSQHDLKFSSVDTFDFSSQMAPQGPGLFAGRGLPPSFGLLPVMPNGGLDTLHPLGLQGPISQSFGIGMPRQRCRDFEERGFCLRGDMCPMEHGVNRIVVEDVQSLSQFNLPVSLPSAHHLGTSTGALPSSSGPSSLLTNNKPSHGKNSKPGVTDEGLGLNRGLSTSAGAGEADVYDPDQPLWSNDHPERSSALIGPTSPNTDDAEMLWSADSSARNNFKVADGFDSEQPGRSTAGSQNTSSSVWGRIGNSGIRSDMTGKFDSTVASFGYHDNEAKEHDGSLPTIPGASHHRKRIASEDAGPKAMNSAAASRLRNEHVRNINKTSQKALRTLFVNGIPLKNNKRDALFSHFQKFGEVIDIYIPLNSERAFVQFSKREEAEAALKAPDAVMGNRFIKLWWANRDSIPDNNVSTGHASSASPSVAASTAPQVSAGDKGKENHPSVGLKVTATASSDAPVQNVVNPRPAVTNVPKSAPPSQKKLENLEFLKEQLRLKQEMLDQKRNAFRRQLDKLEKKAIVKGETTSEHTANRPKVGMVTDVIKAVALRPSNPITAGQHPGADKTLDKDHSMSPSSKTNSTALLQSPKSLKHQIRPPVPSAAPFVGNRFKLDNRPSTFRVLPPLPDEFANVGVLREHFSSFGDLSAVELEDHEANEGVDPSNSSNNCSVCVTFNTRSSAERAFSNGKSWQGRSLKFSWLVVSSNSSNKHNGRENYPTPTLNGALDAEVLTETTTTVSSSTVEKATCLNFQAAVATENGKSYNSEAIKGSVEAMDQLETCHSSQTTLSSCETLSSKSEKMLVADGLHVKTCSEGI